MKIYSENEIVRIQKDVEVDIIGERRKVLLRKGSIGTIVLVHGGLLSPLAYEVEFFIQEQDCYGLATLDVSVVSDA